MVCNQVPSISKVSIGNSLSNVGQEALKLAKNYIPELQTRARLTVHVAHLLCLSTVFHPSEGHQIEEG